MLNTKGGEGPSMLGTKYVRFRGSMRWTRFFWSFVCDTSCIHIYFHALYYIHVMVRLMWHVCSLHCYIYIYMSCHLDYAHLLCFCILLRFKWALLHVLMLSHIYWVHHVGLSHISISNLFVLIIKSIYEPSMLKTSLISFTYSRLCCHQSPKRGRLKASRPLVGFWWLMMTRDYYD